MMLSGVFPRLRSLVASVIHRHALDRAMDDEFALHLDLRTEDLVRQGMPRDEALRRARIEFGNVTAAKETARASWGTSWLDSLRQDLGFALRTLRRNPGFTTIAVLSLGAGIGATSTMFGVIDAVDFRPLPFRDADRLVWLAEVTPRDHEMCSRCAFLTAPSTAADWAARAHSFEALAVIERDEVAWEHDDLSESLSAGQATPGFLDLLGVKPLLGREFTSGDTLSGAEPVALLSYEFWNARFGADPGVVGRQLPSRDGSGASAAPRPVRIIGVLPEDFHFKIDAQLWVPLRVDANASRTSRDLMMVGRLRSTHTLASANAELATLSARLALTYPTAYRGWGARAEPLRNLLAMAAAKGRFVLFVITTLVLFIAVLNVAGLLLGRAAARQQEFAMRTALGASRGRLIRQLLVEGSCVGLGGGIFGVLLSLWAERFVPRWFSIESSGLALGVDHRMLAFAASVSMIVGVGAAVAPALRAASMDPSSPLRRGTADMGRHTPRTSNTLITLQIAVALVLLTAAGLLSRDFLELRYLDLGYDPHGLYRTSMSGTREQRADPVAWSAIPNAARRRIAAIPGVLSASLEHASAIHPQIVRPEGAASSGSVTPFFKAVDPNYFSTFGTRLLFGRPFTAADGRGAPLVAIVNKMAAETFWPGQDPIGRRIVAADSGSIGELLTVIGVGDDAERGELFQRHWPMVYRPFEQAKIYHTAAALYVRVSDNGSDALSAAQSIIRQETGRPANSFRSEEQALSGRLLVRRLNALALDLFAVFGLLLAAMGIYGSVAHAVTRRTREIGIRIALGAERWSVISLVARHSLLQAVGGVSVGIIAAFALTRVLRSFMLGTSVTNPWVFGGSCLLMIGIAFAATPRAGSSRYPCRRGDRSAWRMIRTRTASPSGPRRVAVQPVGHEWNCQWRRIESANASDARRRWKGHVY